MKCFKPLALVLLALFVGIEFSLISVQANAQKNEDVLNDYFNEERFIYISTVDMSFRRMSIAFSIERRSSGVIRDVDNLSFDDSESLLTFSGSVRNEFHREISCFVSPTPWLGFRLSNCVSGNSLILYRGKYIDIIFYSVV